MELLINELFIYSSCPKPINHNDLDKVLNKFYTLLQTTDLVFSSLRLYNPTEKEMSKIEKVSFC